MAASAIVAFASALVIVCTSKVDAVNTLPKPEALIQPSPSDLPTVTVRGFLNFRTTVDGTVIVFTPSSETPQQPQNEALTPTKAAKVEFSPESTVLKSGTPKDTSLDKSQDFQDLSQANKVFGFEIEPDDVDGSVPPKITPSSTKSRSSTSSSRSAIFPVKTSSTSTIPKAAPPKSSSPKSSLKASSRAAVKSSSSTSSKIFGKIVTQTNAPVTRIVENTANNAAYPTGLVTVLGGTMVSQGATTIHETKVIGTYIQGKYAQILESTSKIIQPTPKLRDVAPSPTYLAPGQTASALPNLQRLQEYSDEEGLASLNASPRSIERRGGEDDDDLAKFLQSSFKSATDFRPQAKQTSRLEPKFTETVEDENKIQNSKRQGARSQSSSARLRYTPLQKSHSVRLNRFKVRLTSRYEDQTALPSEVEQLNAFDSHVKALDLDDPLLNIDPARITWVPTTITSLVTLRAGHRKSVIRTLTITTSIPTTIEASEVLSNGISDNGIEPTPSLVQSRTYSTEQHTWRTSLVPASHDGQTSMQTITESFVIRKFVTAYRTMPTGETGEEAANETLSALDETDDSYIQTLLAGGINATATTKNDVAQASVNILNELQNALQKNPLAALLLGLTSQLQPSLQTVTKSSTYLTTDTLYNTKVVSFYDGRRTRSKTLRDSIGTTERTLTSYSTEVITLSPTQQYPFPFLLQPTPTPSYSTVTSVVTTVTTGTSYSSKIFTLIYNAFSTRYRTVTSSSTYPTTMVITSSSSFLVQPTVYPGYPPQHGYPPQYHPQHPSPPQAAPAPPVAPVVQAAPVPNAAPAQAAVFSEAKPSPVAPVALSPGSPNLKPESAASEELKVESEVPEGAEPVADNSKVEESSE